MTLPLDSDLHAVSTWPPEDLAGWFDRIWHLWDHHYGTWKQRGQTYRLATGGWSENEGVIYAMMENAKCWGLTWEMSRVGGLYVFRIPRRGK